MAGEAVDEISLGLAGTKRVADGLDKIGLATLI